jgi:uncharacterized protein (DUF433 family)
MMAATDGTIHDPRLADGDWLRAEYAVKGARHIAAELGCSHHRVYDALRAAGIPVRSNGIHVGRNKSMVPPEIVEEVVARYVSGSTAEQIAGEFDLAVTAVSELLEERGVKRSRSEAAALRHARQGPASGPRQSPAELVVEVVHRYAAGESDEVIAGLLQLAALGVYRLVH